MRAFTLALVALLVVSGTAVAQVHRIAVQSSGSKYWNKGTAVAIGRIDGREFLLTNEHLFEVRGKKIVRPVVKIETLDAGTFPAIYHGGSETKGSTGVDLALVSVRSRKPWKSYVVSDSVPTAGETVTIEAFPFGKFRRRRSTVSGYNRRHGLRSSGTAQPGESGGAILHGGKLVALVWGNQYGDLRGTFGTQAIRIATFVRERFSGMYGETSQVVFDPTLSISSGSGAGVSLRSPVVFTAPGVKLPECRVEMFSAPWCGPCENWKRTEIGKVRAAGIHVVVFEDDARARAARVSSYPTFIIFHNGREQARCSGFAAGTRTTASEIVDIFRSTHPESPSAINKGWKPIAEPTRTITIPAAPDSRIGENARAIADLTSAVGRLTTHVAGIRPTDVSEIEERLAAIEGIEIPVRIETSSGKLIREKRYRLERDEEGKLVFKPIVLKFDEAILRGGVPAIK
jgi:hypothetical protein